MGRSEIRGRADALAVASPRRAEMTKLPNGIPGVQPLPVPDSASDMVPLVTTCALDALAEAPALTSPQ